MQGGPQQVDAYTGSQTQKWGLVVDLLGGLMTHSDASFVDVGAGAEGGGSGGEARGGEAGCSGSSSGLGGGGGDTQRRRTRAGSRTGAGAGADQGGGGAAACAGGEGGEAPRERRTTLRWYLTWARRLVVVRAVTMLLWS